MSSLSEAPGELDRVDAAGEVAARAEAFRNWGRWGDDDAIGTLNFIDAAKRVAAAALVVDGETVSLAQSFDEDGPQRGWKKRNNPVHTMTGTGLDHARDPYAQPHGIGGADDMIVMPLQCFYAVGRARAHLRPRLRVQRSPGRRGRDHAGDSATGIENAAEAIVSRGVCRHGAPSPPGDG